ncbi:predicted protein [Chaetoceros tenuissimus]|uniref:SET domain-containing protein n=1 Tax=Chaetoceros tenuissimus TaxID=426638 RepID=A0AAD3CMY9_9STRA|nr:predicted protein [Chaetoceros tenuissimus]
MPETRSKTKKKTEQRKSEKEENNRKELYAVRVKMCKLLKQRENPDVMRADDDQLACTTRRAPKGASEVMEEMKRPLLKKTDKPPTSEVKVNIYQNIPTEKWWNTWFEDKSGVFWNDVRKAQEKSHSLPNEFYEREIHHKVQWSKIIISECNNPCLNSYKDTTDENVMYQLHFHGMKWVHIAKSKRENGGWGLFASRRFETGDSISIYIGYKQNVMKSEYRCHDVDTTDLKNHLFLGAHFINSATFNTDKNNVFIKGPKKGKKNKERANVKYRTDYLVQARARIEKGQEILADYKWYHGSS